MQADGPGRGCEMCIGDLRTGRSMSRIGAGFRVDVEGLRIEQSLSALVPGGVGLQRSWRVHHAANAGLRVAALVDSTQSVYGTSMRTRMTLLNRGAVACVLACSLLLSISHGTAYGALSACEPTILNAYAFRNEAGKLRLMVGIECESGPCDKDNRYSVWISVEHRFSAATLLGSGFEQRATGSSRGPVSYTHLTLPTN